MEIISGIKDSWEADPYSESQKKKQSHKGCRLQEERAPSAGGRVGLESDAEAAF